MEHGKMADFSETICNYKYLEQEVLNSKELGAL